MDNNIFLALSNLKDKAETTRSGHSTSASFFGSISLLIKAIIIVGSTITTTLIFSDYSLFNNVTFILLNVTIDNKIYMFIAGISSLIIFILSLMDLVLAYDKRSEKHNDAIKKLTTLIREMKISKDTKNIDLNSLTMYQNRYNEINETSPTIPDRLFLHAVQKYNRKRATVMEIKENPFRRIWQINWHLLINYDNKKYR